MIFNNGLSKWSVIIKLSVTWIWDSQSPVCWQIVESVTPDLDGNLSSLSWCVQGLSRCGTPSSLVQFGGHSEHTIIVEEKNQTTCVHTEYTTARWATTAGKLFVWLFHAYLCCCICFSIRNLLPGVQIQTCLIYLILESTMKLASLLDWKSMVSDAPMWTVKSLH